MMNINQQKIAIISGSMRQEGESTRIAHVLENKLNNNGHDAFVVEAKDLPAWDEGMWGAEGLNSKWGEIWGPLSQNLKDVDGFILLAPEYNGTAPAALKNFLHCLSVNEAAHKPALLIGVSGSINGAYPIAELRATASKNNKLIFMPDHLVIRNAAEVLKDDIKPEFEETNTYINERVDYSLDVLIHYAEATQSLRHIKIPDAYKFGM